MYIQGTLVHNKNKKNIKGFALVLSIVLLLVMSLMSGTLVVITSSDHKSNNFTDHNQQAFYVAETGLLEAEKYLINTFMGLPKKRLQQMELSLKELQILKIKESILLM